jgi:hypothetical protein
MGGRPAPERSARPQGGADLRHLARRAEPVKLLRLGEAIPRGPQVLQRLRQFARAGFRAVEQATRIVDRHHRLVCKGSHGRKRSGGSRWQEAAVATALEQRLSHLVNSKGFAGRPYDRVALRG